MLEVSQICKRTSNICGVASHKNWRAKTAYFGTVFSKQLREMPKNPPSVNADYDYGASGVRLCRIANVNETIRIQSLVS